MSNHPEWTFLHPQANYDHLGYLPTFLNIDDPRPAREQLDSNYQHGGGWNPFKGFKLIDSNFTIQYPGDPAYHALATTTLHGDTIVFYPHAWVAVFKPDGSFEISRMD